MSRDPTAAQLRALAAIRDGKIDVEYPSGAFLKYARDIRIDTLCRVIEAGWAEISSHRQPTAYAEVAAVVLTRAGEMVAPADEYGIGARGV